MEERRTTSLSISHRFILIPLLLLFSFFFLPTFRAPNSFSSFSWVERRNVFRSFLSPQSDRGKKGRKTKGEKGEKSNIYFGPSLLFFSPPNLPPPPRRRKGVTYVKVRFYLTDPTDRSFGSVLFLASSVSGQFFSSSSCRRNDEEGRGDRSLRKRRRRREDRKGKGG